jgi:two-component system response regulator QseB
MTGSPPIILVGHADIRELLAELLHDEGYAVLSPDDPAVALALARNGPARLIMIGPDVPDLDGAAFRRTFREHGGTAPIILITDATVGRVNVARYGADGSIARPFDLEMVVETVARLVGRR